MPKLNIDWKQVFENIKVFIYNVPSTLQKTTIWLVISYLIPIINVGIIWGIQRENFQLNLSIISIILVTNACFVTGIFYLVYLTEKKREITNVINIVTFVITVVLFSLSIVQIETEQTIFSIELYKQGAFLTLGLSILLGLISKYDEVEAHSKVLANKGKGKEKTTIGGNDIKL